jgi:signal transduction histidine kinase
MNQVITSEHPAIAGIALETAEIDPFIGETIESMQAFADRKHLQLVADLRAGKSVQMAPALMVIALQNLIENAIEATSAGTVKVSSRADNRSVVIRVEDSGPGIPRGMASVLFQPYATFGKSGGTGLGLSGASAVVKKHGGVIEARNSSHGACFTIRLPLNNEPGNN